MSNSQAKITRQATGPEMSDYLDTEIYSLCEAIADNGTAPAGSANGIATIKFIELFRVSRARRFTELASALSTNTLTSGSPLTPAPLGGIQPFAERSPESPQEWLRAVQGRDLAPGQGR